jgi:3-phosphoshikimate 1-carboxyvinyltransferase
VVIEVVGELISKPYIEITLNLLARFGIAGAARRLAALHHPAGSRYRTPGEIHVEADASSASYFIALGAMHRPRPGHRCASKVWAATRSRATSASSRRPRPWAPRDGGPNWLEVHRGAWPLKAIDLDCNHIPDAAMTLAVMALYADGTTTLRNIASWRVKETDRIAAMATELRKLGATVEEGADFIRGHAARAPTGKQPASTPTTTTAWPCVFRWPPSIPAGLPVRIEDPKCVAKDISGLLRGAVLTWPRRPPGGFR